MALSKKIEPLLKTNKESGFGVYADYYGGRFFNREGTFIVLIDGVSFMRRYSMYLSILPRCRDGNSSG